MLRCKVFSLCTAACTRTTWMDKKEKAHLPQNSRLNHVSWYVSVFWIHWGLYHWMWNSPFIFYPHRFLSLPLVFLIMEMHLIHLLVSLLLPGFITVQIYWKLFLTTTYHFVGGDDFLEDLWKQALGLQVRVLVTEVEHQQGVAVGSGQSRGKGQDALLQVSYCWKAAQLFKGHNGILQRERRQIKAGLACSYTGLYWHDTQNDITIN